MTGPNTPAERAATLLKLHRPGNPVILPTVWDAWSARLAVGAGFAALTVGSHPMADSIGKSDNEGMSFDDVLTRVAQITAAVSETEGVPVSVDIESGYGLPADRLIEGLLSVGAVGLNIEDTPCTRRADGCGPPRNTPSWSARCGRPPTRWGCMWSSTPGPICSCAKTARSPIASTAPWHG
ncbi:hypothetical protein MINTM021_47650 [Mycobacterium paraintracellulare]|nr:hypothetical protein MINTM021_47650 [Mycobacterium paraintracellulare]